jgi:hypothetical protein
VNIEQERDPDHDDCEDQYVGPMPERCIVWPCCSKGDAAKLVAVERYGHLYMTCPLCQCGYGEVR